MFAKHFLKHPAYDNKNSFKTKLNLDDITNYLTD